MPLGLLNKALVPVPSANPAVDPASVFTTPPFGMNPYGNDIIRMRTLSETNTLPLASTATPLRPLNKAAGPVPSAYPLVDDPASVVTTPPGVTMRMRLLPKSVINALLSVLTATLIGL
jgi:hypothetical protein